MSGNEIINYFSSKSHSIDLLIMSLLTIPVFLIYVVYTLVFFLKIDKKYKEKYNYYEKHGLSRFCLAGIFFLFGLIIFDINFEFITAYITQYVNEAYLSPKIYEKLNKSIIYKGISAMYKNIPIDVLINFTIICTAIYTSTEGIIASLKTLKVEAGVAIELPAIKRVRLSAMFILWGYIAIICSIYTFLIGSETVSFYLKNVYISTGLTLVILFLAERAPSMLQDTSTKPTKLVKTADNVVKEFNENDGKSYIDPDVEKLWNNNNVCGDKISDEQLKEININNIINTTNNDESKNIKLDI